MRITLSAVAAVASLVLAGSAAGVVSAKAIDSGGGVLVNDYDGHPHRTSPKRIGEHINLWCRSSTDRAQAVTVRTFFEAREVAARTIICPRGENPHRHRIVRVKAVGVYGMVLDGGGFDSFVIRTRTRRRERLTPGPGPITAR
jgi:hypothetical protein